jgi:hypothetical protein
MAKHGDAGAREQRLAAKLRENLRRRKDQARARAGAVAVRGEPDGEKPSGGSKPEPNSGG